MKPLSRFNQLFSALALTVASTTLQAQNVELDIERSVKVEFNSQKGYSYNVYGTSDPAKKTGWKLLGGGDGTGESIVFFYRTETDQKVFFKVESEPSEPGEEPKPQEPVQSIIPITGLPPAESSGTYNLLESIGENEIGGVYRIGVSAGTDGLVIELPHPGQKEYRQKQIKLSIYRGGTGLGSGKVSLKVPTLAGDEYESRKLVDNGAKQITDEVIILPATASKDGRKVIVELFNDTASTDGAAGGQWVVTTAAEAVAPTVEHERDGTNVRLKNADGSWGEWVNLQGQKGDKGDRGSSEYEWSGTKIRFKEPDATWGQWVDLKGDKGNPGKQSEFEWNGSSLRLQKTDGSWGEWIDLQGQKGDRGSVDYEWSDSSLRFKQPNGAWGQWVKLQGAKGDKGPPGNVSAQGYDLAVISAGIHRDWSNQKFDGKDLHGIFIEVAGYKDVDGNWTYLPIENSQFSGANLSYSRIQNDAVFINCNFKNANLSYADLGHATFISCNFNGANFALAYLENSKFINCSGHP
jgi:hypothetical protein